MRIYKDMRDFDGMDKSQKLWQAMDGTGSCIAWVVSDGESEDDVNAAVRSATGIEPYAVYLRDDAESFAIMLRHDAEIARMLDEISRTLAKWWHAGYFTLNEDFEAGYEMGRRCDTMPLTPRNRDPHQYERGLASGMIDRMAVKAGVEPMFVREWVIEDKALRYVSSDTTTSTD